MRTSARAPLRRTDYPLSATVGGWDTIETACFDISESIKPCPLLVCIYSGACEKLLGAKGISSGVRIVLRQPPTRPIRLVRTHTAKNHRSRDARASPWRSTRPSKKEHASVEPPKFLEFPTSRTGRAACLVVWASMNVFLTKNGTGYSKSYISVHMMH